MRRLAANACWPANTASVLAVVAVLAMAGGTAAKAQESRVFAQHDVRGRTENGIVTAAVSASMHTVALIVRTSDQSVWPVAFQTAQALSQEGYPVSFVLAGDGPDELNIYARGVAVSRINNPGTSRESANTIRAEMLRAYELAFGD